MTTIKLLDARRGLYRKCEELFNDAKIAEAIYRYLCEGIEECEDTDVPERKVGKWKQHKDYPALAYLCSDCGYFTTNRSHFCPNCGSDMRKERT